MYKVLKKMLSVILMATTLVAAMFLAPPTVVQAANTTYYVDSDPLVGNDGNTGTSPGTAWRTLSKVNQTTFEPGDRILFKAGGTWTGQLYPLGSGVEGNSIIIDMYGTGNKPIINGNGIEGGAVYLYNQQYWEINNLEVINNSATEGYRNGVKIECADIGVCNHIYLKNLYVHDVKGIITTQSYEGKGTGGILYWVSTNVDETKRLKTNFNDILVENCTVYNTDRSGIIVATTEWRNRKGENTGKGAWNGQTGVVVRNNYVDNIAGDGIVVDFCTSPLVEYNVSKEAHARVGIGPAGGIWAWSCDNAVFQFNEAYLTRCPYGVGDGVAYDCDAVSDGTTYQYNYSHDNEGGFMLICAYADWFCSNSIVRYNISQNDKLKIFNLYGYTTNTQIYNNTFYMGEGISNTKLVEFQFDNVIGRPQDSYFYNNVFYNKSSGVTYNDYGINTVFDYNVFYGNPIQYEPYDPHKLTSDPKFVNPGSGGIGINTVDGYKLQWDSPCINSGMSIDKNGGRDYWGNSLYKDAPDRGAHEYTSCIEAYKEDFSDGQAQNWVTSGGTWTVESNEYSSASNQSGCSYYNGANSTFGDFVYNTKARFVGSTQRDMSFMFRLQDPNNYYQLFISKYPGYEYIRLYKTVNGSCSQIGTEQAYVAPVDTDLNISIQCEGSVITATVSGGTSVKTVSATDNTFSSGMIGLCSNLSHIHFDNIEAYPTKYYEDFTDGQAQNWTVGGGTWAVESNEYSGSNGFAYSYYNGTDSTFDNFIYNIKARFVGSTQGDLNILFRYQDSNNFYNLFITRYPGYESVCLAKTVNGSYCQIGTGQVYIAPVDTDLNISIRCEGNVITATVNDGTNIKTVSATDNTFSAGKIGLCSNQSHIHFDNIEVFPTIKYVEDFNDGQAQNWTIGSGTWSVESNEYSGTNGNAYSYYNATNSTYDDFVYNVKARFVGSTQRDLDILFRYQDLNNFYNLFITKYPGYESVCLAKTVNGSYYVIGTEQIYNAPVDTDIYISIRCDGNIITATLNDGTNMKSLSAVDNTFSSGKIGLFSNLSHIHFDNIEVYE